MKDLLYLKIYAKNVESKQSKLIWNKNFLRYASDIRHKPFYGRVFV